MYQIVDTIDRQEDLASIGFIMNGTALEGFSTNSSNPLETIERKYDYIIAFTDEIKEYRKGNINKEDLKTMLVDKLSIFIYKSLCLNKNLK